MLKLIVKFVGKPRDESELAFVTNPKAQKFMEDLPEYPPADLRRRFPSAGADAVDLLARMLVMRPDRRLSVDEALRHPYLRSLRDKKVLLCFSLSSHCFVCVVPKLDCCREALFRTARIVVEFGNSTDCLTLATDSL